jgi:hypothetical protein
MGRDGGRVKKTYGLAEIANAIGIQRGTLHSWLARNYVEVETPGKGVERRFTFEQVVWLGALAAMTRRGIEIGKAAERLHAVRPRFLRAIRHNDGHGAVLFMEGEQEWIDDAESLLVPFLNSLKLPHDKTRPEDVYILPLGPLVARIKAALDGTDAVAPLIGFESRYHY